MRFSAHSALWLQPLLLLVNGITVDPTDQSSLEAGAKVAIDGMLSFYVGNQSGGIPGIFPQSEGYFWWMAGAAWNALMNYWWYTGDSTYNDFVMGCMMFQTGANNDFMPSNQTHSEGNDDQSFWALAAMSAAEMNFPNPPDTDPSWLSLAQAVYNEQVARWDTQNCGGGLRWQIFPFNNGYDYKNSISNGCHFHLAARLARYTGNSTYFDVADMVYTWMETVGLLTSDFSVYDGGNIPNCTTGVDPIQWTYNNAQLLSGAAYLYNYTNGNATWQGRLDSLLAAAKAKFFQNTILWEPACESNDSCDIDQYTFKGYLASYLGIVARIAPYTASDIFALLEPSATAAGNHCNAGSTGQMCTMFWTTDSGPQTLGVGQQMSALNVFTANMAKFTVLQPVTSNSGGTSQGNPNAGSTNDDQVDTIAPATTGDKVLAGVLTSLFSVGSVGFAAWLAI